MMLQQLSFDSIIGGLDRRYSLGDFSAIPLAGAPPYLASSRNEDGPLDYLFQHKTTLEVGLLLSVGRGCYYFAPPTLLSPRHQQPNQVKHIRALDGWQAVCEQLEALGYDGTVITLGGSDE